MSQIINLRTRRKQATREAARQEGASSAAQHGLSKSQKTLAKARSDKASHDLDQHRRDPSAPKG